MLLSSISETTYYEKREKNGTSVGFYSTGLVRVSTLSKLPTGRYLESSTPERVES